MHTRRVFFKLNYQRDFAMGGVSVRLSHTSIHSRLMAVCGFYRQEAQALYRSQFFGTNVHT